MILQLPQWGRPIVGRLTEAGVAAGAKLLLQWSPAGDRPADLRQAGAGALTALLQWSPPVIGRVTSHIPFTALEAKLAAIEPADADHRERGDLVAAAMDRPLNGRMT